VFKSILNGEFDSGDLIVILAAFDDGGYELGPRLATAQVPEPTILGQFGVLPLALLLYRHRRNAVRESSTNLNERSCYNHRARSVNHS
jgi:hypothetical protein